MSVQGGASKSFQIVRNLSFLTAGKLLGDIFSFIFYVFLSRFFGQEGFGHYSFALGFTSFCIAFADFGLYNFSIKDLSRKTTSLSLYSGKILAVRLVLSAAVLCGLLLATAFIPYSPELRAVILLVGAYQIIMTLVNGFGAFLIARENMQLAGTLEASLKITTALASMGVILAGGSLVVAVSVFPLVAAFHVWLGYFWVKKHYGRPELAISWSQFIDSLRQALPFATQFFLYLLTARMDVVLIGFFMGTAAAGLYNAAYRVVFVLMFLSAFANLTLFPLASKLYANSDEKLKELYRRSVRMMVLIGLPASAGLWLTAPSLIPLLFGEDFAPSIPVLRLLAWLVFLGCCKGLMITFLAACDRQAEVVKRQALVVGIGFAAQLLLIPALGIVGAAYALLLSETILLILYMRQLKLFLGPAHIFSRVLMSGTAILAFLIPFSSWPSLSMAVTIPAATLIYGSVLLLFKELRLDEFQLLLAILREGSAKLALGGRRAL